MPRACTLAIDQGTHATRALVFDECGRVLAEARQTVGLRTWEGGCVEQDPNEILRSLDRVLEQLFQLEDVDPGDISAAGLATQRSSVVAWRRSGEALSPILSWQDTRAEAGVDALSGHADEIRARTGLRLSPHYGASKIRWLLANNPELEGPARTGDLLVGPLAGFVLQHLSDGLPGRVDEANASRTLLWNLHQRRWDPWLLDLFGIPDSVLPNTRPVCASFGRLRRWNIPIKAVGGDQGAALYAFGPPSTNELYVNVGTGAFVLLPLAPRTGTAGPAEDRLLNTVTTSDSGRVSAALEGTVNGAGAALAWLAGQIKVGDVWSLLPESLERVRRPPLFLNSIGGLGSPWWRAGPCPGLVGPRKRFGDPLAAVAAVTESILFLIERNVELLQAMQQEIRGIRISGGLARFDLLCQRLADLSGLPVTRAAEVEASARGIAWQAAGRASAWRDPGNMACFAPRHDGELQARYHAFLAALEKALA